MIDIIIADDHPIFRQGIVSIIEKCHQINILGQAQNGEEALQLIKTLKPKIAVLDIDMPKLTGLDVIRQLNRIDCGCYYIILTMHKEVELYYEIQNLNISGYLLKDSATEELVECIKTVNQGKIYTDKLILEQIKNNTNVNSKLNELTKTEKNVLKLIARDLSTKEIAEMLFVSPKTIENHRANICKKLNITGVNAIQKFLLKNKINKY